MTPMTLTLVNVWMILSWFFRRICIYIYKCKNMLILAILSKWWHLKPFFFFFKLNSLVVSLIREAEIKFTIENVGEARRRLT